MEVDHRAPVPVCYFPVSSDLRWSACARLFYYLRAVLPEIA